MNIIHTFALIATIYNADAAPDVYVMDAGISSDDCIYALITLQPIVRDDVTLSCEYDEHGWAR